MGDLKGMSPRWLVGSSFLGYGCTLSVGLGIPIPVLDEEVVRAAAVSDAELFAPLVDYSHDYPQGTGRVLGEVSYAQLKSGKIIVEGKEVPAAPLSSYPRAREIAGILKRWIEEGSFLLTEPVELLPCPARDRSGEGGGQG